jgi:hypothetical protein
MKANKVSDRSEWQPSLRVAALQVRHGSWEFINQFQLFFKDESVVLGVP